MSKNLPDGVTYELYATCSNCYNCNGLDCAIFKVPKIKKEYTFRDIVKTYGHQQVFDKVINHKRGIK